MTAHLKQLPEGSSVRSGETVQVECGGKVNSAQIVGCWDAAEELRKVDLDQVRGLCGKCKKLYVPLEGRSLLYAVSCGESE